MAKYVAIADGFEMGTFEAFQMTKERRLDNSEWPEWLHQAWNLRADQPGSMFTSGGIAGDDCTPLFVQTKQGTAKVEWGDFIVLNLHAGYLFPCKADVFKEAFEKVDETDRKGPKHDDIGR